MPQETLNEREFELVNIVGAQIGANQRDLSRLMDLSLGMTNMLLRRLITKGYIRIKQLNQKKVEYMLTPKGFAEKMRKSVKYTLKTINSISLIKKRLQNILSELYKQGERNFLILGESDLSLLVEIILKQICTEEYHVSHMKAEEIDGREGVLLVCTEDYRASNGSGRKVVNLIEEIAKEGMFPEFSEGIKGAEA